MSQEKCAECGGEINRETFACSDCGADVWVCDDCGEITKGCPCGHCEEGAGFIEE
jgi:hypothetical protein